MKLLDKKTDFFGKVYFTSPFIWLW